LIVINTIFILLENKFLCVIVSLVINKIGETKWNEKNLFSSSIIRSTYQKLD